MKRDRSRKLQSGRRLAGAFSASAVITLLAWGCGSSNEEKLRAAELAGSCSINSNCAGLLVCAFGRCHEECDEDRDCRPIGLRCMNAPVEAGVVGVCQLPEEVTCENDRECPGETQVCGVDNECRDPCEGDADCTPTQICANSDECASTDEEYDIVDENGNIVAQGGSSGTGGSVSGGGEAGTSSAGRGGSDTVSSGGTGAVQAGNGGADSGGNDSGAGGGESGAGGAPSVGSGAGGQGGTPGNAGGSAGAAGEGEGGDDSPGSGGDPSGAAGMSGGGAGGGLVQVLTETPDGIELVDNDTREKAVAAPLPSRATIYVNNLNDQDWFSLTVPDDGHPQVISIVIEQEAGASTQISAQTLINYAPINSLEYGTGTTGYAYLTVGSGATVLLNCFRRPGPVTAGLAHLTFHVEAENDAHEPNNTKETATLIEPEQIYSGIISAPWISDLDRPEQDWFAVDLEVGTTTVGFTSVPSQGRIALSRFNPSGGETNMGANGTGATGDFASFSVPEAGRYYFMFEPNSGISGFVNGTKPTYLTEPYSFRVTQQ